MISRALYIGSFDPVTNGHLDIVIQALNFVQHLTLAIGLNPNKVPMFTKDERLKMLKEACTRQFNPQKERLTFIISNKLTIETARDQNCKVLIRGLRQGADFDHEMQIARINALMDPKIQTLFLAASAQVQPITSTMVKQIAAFNGDVEAFVPINVMQALKKPLSAR